MSHEHEVDGAQAPRRLTEAVFDVPHPARAGGTRRLIGVLPGEGVGPELVRSALLVLKALEEQAPPFEVRFGGSIGLEAQQQAGCALTADVTEFCEEIFGAGGAILAGPGGGRFVYDLRRRFDLFCKLVPLRVSPALAGAGRLRREGVLDVDILLVRENVGGTYQGTWREMTCLDGERTSEHTFSYTESQVRRILRVAARLAAGRRGDLAVVLKEGGLPAQSGLWRDIGQAEADRAGVRVSFVNVDLAAYRLIQEPRTFDVVAASNLFGDVLADLGGVLLGSRGLGFSGNFSGSGAAVYQTNHGGARDVAGQDRANPAAQILSLAMLLRESFGYFDLASRIETALEEVWESGIVTFDLAGGGRKVVGTAEMTARVAEAVAHANICPG